MDDVDIAEDELNGDIECAENKLDKAKAAEDELNDKVETTEDESAIDESGRDHMGALKHKN